MIQILMDWLGQTNIDDSVLRFAILPICVSAFTIPLGALWAFLAQLFGVVFRGRRK